MKKTVIGNLHYQPVSFLQFILWNCQRYSMPMNEDPTLDYRAVVQLNFLKSLKDSLGPCPHAA